MAEIVRRASAGSLESSDVYVEIGPGRAGIEFELESVVRQQFGQAIRDSVFDVLAQRGVRDAVVRVRDRGALDCVLRARVETAIRRGEG